MEVLDWYLVGDSALALLRICENLKGERECKCYDVVKEGRTRKCSLMLAGRHSAGISNIPPYFGEEGQKRRRGEELRHDTCKKEGDAQESNEDINGLGRPSISCRIIVFLFS